MTQPTREWSRVASARGQMQLGASALPIVFCLTLLVIPSAVDEPSPGNTVSAAEIASSGAAGAATLTEAFSRAERIATARRPSFDLDAIQWRWLSQLLPGTPSGSPPISDRSVRPGRRHLPSARELSVLEAAGVLQRKGQSIEVGGVLHRPFLIWKAGRPVLNRSGRLHEKQGGLVDVTGDVTLPPIRRRAWKLSRELAVARATKLAAIQVPHRGSPLAEAGWYALDEETIPVWRVVIPARRPFGTWQIIVDASTGDEVALVDLIQKIEGVGLVYDPSPAVAPIPIEVPLLTLDESGHLSGAIARVFDRGSALAFRPNHRFVFPPDDPRFVQTSVYRALTDTALFAEEHGFPVFTEPVPAHVNLLDPNSGEEINNAFYDPFFPAFGFGNGDGVVAANLGTDLDVGAHEMGHHLFRVLVEPSIVTGFEPVTAIIEGIADTMAALVSGDPYIGESTVPGEPFLRTLDNSKSFPADEATDPHETGLIYGGTNWELIQSLGPDLFARILFAGLPFLDPSPFPFDYRDALLEGDTVETGGSNHTLIRSVFSARGFDDLDFPPEFEGFLSDEIPVSSTLPNGTFHYHLFHEFPGSRAIEFRTTGSGDADLCVAPASDPASVKCSQGTTTNELVRLTRSTTPSVDDEDWWLVRVWDYPSDYQSSSYTLTARVTLLPAPAIVIGGAPFEGSIDEHGEVDFVAFTGTANRVVRLEAKGLDPSLDPVAGIVRIDPPEVLGADDDSGPGTDSLIQGVRLPASGTYAIMIFSPLRSGLDPMIGTGPYRLTLSICSNNTGPDSDGDTLRDACDPDDDEDGFIDRLDANPVDPLACEDLDLDDCDDCSNGTFDASNDGPDTDGDGLCDTSDVDDDNDGCTDKVDPAPQTHSGDQDFDFLGDDCDNCRSVPNADQADMDGDEIGDACDNCRHVSNVAQTDGDQDGIGNLCDGDFDQSGFCNVTDLLRFLEAFGKQLTDATCPDSVGDPTGSCARYDLTGEGAVINVNDLLALIDPDMFGTSTSAHGCAPADDGVVHCPLP